MTVVKNPRNMPLDQVMVGSSGYTSSSTTGKKNAAKINN
jgi:hypothetical protein